VRLLASIILVVLCSVAVLGIAQDQNVQEYLKPQTSPGVLPEPLQSTINSPDSGGVVSGSYQGGYGGYGGEPARLRRQYDPYSRELYFGENASRSLLMNLGQKGPNYRYTNTGRKGAYSGKFNLDTNAFIPQGRYPGRISNWDPNMRGFAQIDRTVYMYPPEGYDLSVTNKALMPQGTARVVSLGDQVGSGLNKPYPKTQVFIQTKNLPPPQDYEAYEGWLFDEKTEYPLSLGLFKNSVKFTSQLYFTIFRSALPFNAVMVTREDLRDPNPSPGEVVLYGTMDPVRTQTSQLGYIYAQRVR